MQRQVKTSDFLQISMPKMLLEGGCHLRNYVWWFANQIAWMTSNVFKSWMMKSQK
jgi:hypothetical protein